MKSIAIIAATAWLGALVAADPIPIPYLNTRQYATLVYQGCFSSSQGLKFNSSYEYGSRGYCQTQCVPAGASVQAETNSKDCWCGNAVPPTSSKVDDSFCNDPCAGIDTEMCGAAGSTYFSVYLTGDDTVPISTISSASASATPSATTSAKPSVVTVGGQTVVVTASSAASAAASTSAVAKSSKPNTAGIAAGAVVGVVAIAAIAGGIFLFLRNRKNRQVEEEYRRNAAVSDFIAGGKPPTSSSGGASFDTRLDPVMAQRRMSDGSIADNEDYSRRILKVTNA